MRRLRYYVLVWVAPVLVAVCLLSLPGLAKYSGGTGEPNDPYQIATVADLIALGEAPGDYGKYFILTADIDLDPNLPERRIFDRAVIAPDTDPSTEWRFEWSPFTGCFDGNGHTISHLTIKGRTWLGLFGEVASGASIKNLGVVDVNVVGSSCNIAGLVAKNKGIMERCYSTGRVSGKYAVGGLVGFNQHSVSFCFSTGTVEGGSSVGGLVGEQYGTGTTVTQCYSAGVVTGHNAVGGLVGTNTYEGESLHPIPGGRIAECYSVAQVKAEADAGGLVGHGWPPDVTTSFWDIETSGMGVSSGGAGKTTDQMQTASTFTDAGWDFAGESEKGLDDIWRMPEGGGYPVLTALDETPLIQFQGQGTPEDPYLISDAIELGAMIRYGHAAHYRLTVSIDLSGVCWSGELISSFAGTFDGAGHTLSHLTDAGGLFGILETGAEVRDLGIVDANITPSGYFATAGLVRYNQGTVTRCFITGTVAGQRNVGGLVGQNEGNVTCCYSTAAVSGDYPVGGLVAHNAGAVTQCYSTGTVTGNFNVGALVGASVHPPQGVVSQCFWDIETSALTKSAGGTGKTTAEMKTAQTFLDAGWDFVGGTDNGTEDVWWIEEGKGYPRLSWEDRGEV